MTATRPFCAGDRVVISNESRGTVIGKIEDIRTPEEMRDTGLMEPDAYELLREEGVTRTAVISYYVSPGNPLMFIAMETGGEWQDLLGQPLNLRHYALN